jgi:CheY-like chemotaxis protein
VDDEPFNLQAFESILQLFGIKSDTAMSGMQAIKLVKEKTEK